MAERKKIKKREKEESKNEEEEITQSSIKKENTILRNILIFLGIIIILFILGTIIIKSSANFDYQGVKFDVVEEGDLTLYHTSFPVLYKEEGAEYNIYLRNDPRELKEKVPAKGTLVSLEDTVINITQEFECSGDQLIAIANMQNIYNAIGKDFIKDENASCDSQGRYMYLTIKPGNETNIEMIGPNCYDINIKDCEILEGTERFIVGMLVKINFDLSK